MNRTAFSFEPKPKVLVINTHISTAELVSILLDREGRHAVVGEATSGEQGIRLFRKHQPDLVITSLTLPDMDGASVISAIREENDEVAFLVYSGARHPGLFLAAQQAGANGLVHETEPLAVLRKALEAVSHGASFTSAHVAGLLKNARRDLDPGEPRLSPRERVVLQLIASGMSSKQIANKISVASKTADYYRTQIMQKLGVNNIAALTRYAVRCGLVSAECWVFASLIEG